MRLKDKVAIVTGAGSGIGQAVAQRFAQEGAKVVAAGRNPADLDHVATAIRDQGGTASAIVVDVARAESVERMVQHALQSFGRVDVLVNNAGILDDFAPAAETSDESWDRVLGTNLSGVFYGCRAVLPAMLKQGHGSIVNVASIGGLFGARAGAAYTASKHGVVGLTKNIGYMYAKTGVRCNAIAPGGVATRIMAGVEPNKFGFERMGTGLATAVRVADPGEIASVAVFLASDESSFVNGAVLTADGGWTAY